MCIVRACHVWFVICVLYVLAMCGLWYVYCTCLPCVVCDMCIVRACYVWFLVKRVCSAVSVNCQDQKYSLQAHFTYTFDSVHQLICFYKNNHLPHRCTKLSKPYTELIHSTASWEYTSQHVSHCRCHTVHATGSNLVAQVSPTLFKVYKIKNYCSPKLFWLIFSETVFAVFIMKYH